MIRLTYREKWFAKHITVSHTVGKNIVLPERTLLWPSQMTVVTELSASSASADEATSPEESSPSVNLTEVIEKDDQWSLRECEVAVLYIQKFFKDEGL